MAMQFCNKRVTQVTTNLLRQLAKPVPMVVEDDHHGGDDAHIAVPKTATPLTVTSMNKFLLKGNASITTGLNSTCRTNKQKKKRDFSFLSISFFQLQRVFVMLIRIFKYRISIIIVEKDVSIPRNPIENRPMRHHPTHT